MSSIAIIVPVLDDAVALQRLLHIVRHWSAQPEEIIVVDGDDDVAIETLCREYGCQRLRTEPCRGAQLDAGARAASAELLWFVHADATPYDISLAAIRTARAAGAEAGYFRFEFDGARNWRKRIIETFVRLRTLCGGIPYGDQGLWIARDAYRDCKGFPHEPLFEEVRLVHCLKARQPLAALEEPLGVSARRWEREGWWARSAKNRLLALGHALGIPPARLAARYYRDMPTAKDRKA